MIFQVGYSQEKNKVNEMMKVENSKIKFEVAIENGKISKETISSCKNWAEENYGETLLLSLDGDFCLNITWTDWWAPGKIHNGDNPVKLNKEYFTYVKHERKETPEETVLDLFFQGNEYIPQELKITYQLKKNDFYIRKRISVRDTLDQTHFLNSLWPVYGTLQSAGNVIKEGGFGNPAALKTCSSGAFFGMEYPAAENKLKEKNGNFILHSGQDIGEKIESQWIVSDWTVMAVTPNAYVKLFFNEYLKDVRAVPLKPYLLYNSWYDVRSEIYTDRPEDIMNEENVLRIARDLKREMTDKRGITLDAFVLDDGWDVYESDWELRQKEFPNGFKPISEELRKMGTDFGIWFGPTGGYSYRMKRINWMKDHGYETVGHEYRYNKAMLCLAGKKYKELFKKRVVDFVKNEGVTYYKWDGIQFSCSEPDHGHPLGIYSRRAVMNSVIEICDAVREVNPEMYLNITSGTWLSPWWMKYANMIWMQGGDYGYANVPSISQRDAAITYRDYVLYEDFGINDFWFPISNLMTHGIIKGHLQKLGGEKEPLDKFTDNSILYFARGVSMWELYVSPNLLTDGEWNAIAQSIRWAKDRFETLKNTEMFGGNPGEKEAYGYLHGNKNRAVAALRNPYITETKITIPLKEEFGMDRKAGSLVLERVYPTRWISPELYSTGADIEISLDGYETAIYEIYPLEEAKEPLVAGVVFSSTVENNDYKIDIYQKISKPVLLNPDVCKDVIEFENTIQDNEKSFEYLSEKRNQKKIEFHLNLENEPVEAQILAVLIEPENQMGKDEGIHLKADINGKKGDGGSQGRANSWQWYYYDLNQKENQVKIQIDCKNTKLKGKVSAYLITREKPEPETITIQLKDSVEERILPPLPFSKGTIQKHHLIKEWIF